MRLVACVILDALRPRTDRQHPVGSHLKVVVQRLHRAIIEGVTRLFVLRAPQQRLMGVGEARAPEVGHRIGLAPDDVVQDPEFRVLQQRADAVDIVVAADHPNGAVVLQDAARFGQPLAREIVVCRQAVELVPIVVASIDLAAFGPEKVASQLQIVGRIGENHVDRLVGKTCHLGNAIALEDRVER